MGKRRLVSRLQNLVLVLLALSAFYLITRPSLIGGSWAPHFQDILTARVQAGDAVDQEAISGLIPAVHLVVTDDKEYGRFGRLYAGVEDPLFQQVSPLLRDALSSAAVVGATADLTLREALDTPGVYLDLGTELPLTAVAAWLGAEVSFERPVRRLALTTEEESAMLYLCGEDGSIFRYTTALPAAAVRALTPAYVPNSAAFAYESNYTTFAPYTVLVSEVTAPPTLRGELPAGYSTNSLLTALDFNAHTNARYSESGGAEVVVESPRTLWVSADGTVSYTGDETVDSALYRVSAAGEAPTVLEYLMAARRLEQALTQGVGAAPLALRDLAVTEESCQVTFGYHHAGHPILFSDSTAADALTVTITGGVITAFRYRCRSYVPQEAVSPLLPPAQAIAVASIYPSAGLSIGYRDGGQEPLSAQWLVG